MALRYFTNVAVPTALNGGVDATTTTWTVDDGSTYPAVPFTARCEDEVVLVTVKSGTLDVTWTVTRGFGDTTGATHSDGLTVDHVVTAEDYRQLYVDNGLVTAPTIAAASDPDTGIYFSQPGPNKMHFVVDGSAVMEVDSGDWQSWLPIRGQSGSNSAPTFSFTSNTNYGMYYGTSQLLFAAAGAAILAIDANQVLAAPAGTESDPVFSSTQDSDTGMYFGLVNILEFATGGNRRMRLDASGNMFLDDGSIEFETEGKGLVSSDGSLMLAFNDEGVSHDDDVQHLPNYEHSHPADVTTGIVNDAYTSLGTLTLWDHTGTNRSVVAQAHGGFTASNTASNLINMFIRVGISIDGGSTYSYSDNTDGFVGRGASAAEAARSSGDRLHLREMHQVDGVATGDVLMNVEYYVVGANDPSGIVNVSAMGTCHQLH